MSSTQHSSLRRADDRALVEDAVDAARRSANRPFQECHERGPQRAEELALGRVDAVLVLNGT